MRMQALTTYDEDDEQVRKKGHGTDDVDVGTWDDDDEQVRNKQWY